MKIGLKKVLICLAFVAAASLAFDSYFNCRPKCLRRALCKVVMARSKSHSCCQAKVQAKKTSAGKCGNGKTCQFKKSQKIATIDVQGVNLNVNAGPIFIADSNLVKSNAVLQTGMFATGPPFRADCRMRSVICVFLI